MSIIVITAVAPAMTIITDMDTTINMRITATMGMHITIHLTHAATTTRRIKRTECFTAKTKKSTITTTTMTPTRTYTASSSTS